LGLADIQNQPYVRSVLLNALRFERLAHAYLFVGPTGIGKKEIALQLAKALNCSGSETQEACDQCTSCAKLASHNHPDVTVLEPEGSAIGIDSIRSINKDVVYRPYEGEKSVYIISEAEKMTEDAANSLLKVLEEPPPYVLLLLLTSNPQALLPTILSRVQKVTFREVPRETVAAKLRAEHELSEERALFYAALAKGNPGEAERLALSETLLEDREEVLQVLEQLVGAPDEFVVFELAEKLAQRRRAVTEVFELLVTLLRDVELLSSEVRSTALINADIESRLQEYADRIPQGTASGAIQLVQQAVRAIDGNANTRLACEVLLLKLRQLLQSELTEEQTYLIMPFARP
jgi:DNA polymerase-3 subunit delta'